LTWILIYCETDWAKVGTQLIDVKLNRKITVHLLLKLLLLRLTLVFMKINFLLFATICLAVTSCKQIQQASIDTNPKNLGIAFYNVENLFDIYDDPNINDEEFTPQGKKNWTQNRYEEKLNHLSKVIQAMDTFSPDVIGLAEIENLKVLEDLCEQPGLKQMGYKIIHKDSPDGRGIDVALLYNPAKLSLGTVDYIRSTLPVGSRPQTRLVLHASGTFAGEPIHFYVNHWPSRSGGQRETEANRLTVAYNVKESVSEVIDSNPAALVVLMGDFNDHPNDRSVRQILDACKAQCELENLMWDLSKQGKGSYNYKGAWGALDQFIVSPNLVDGSQIEVDMSTVKFVQHDWMMYTDDKGAQYPNRTYSGPNYYGGYSDHLPIFMRMVVP
jgi:predicted extracellular nuclease